MVITILFKTSQLIFEEIDMTNMEGSLVFMRIFVADKKIWSQKAEARKDMIQRRNIAWFSQSRNLLFQKDKEEEWNYCYDQHARKYMQKHLAVITVSKKSHLNKNLNFSFFSPSMERHFERLKQHPVAFNNLWGNGAGYDRHIYMRNI